MSEEQHGVGVPGVLEIRVAREQKIKSAYHENACNASGEADAVSK